MASSSPAEGIDWVPNLYRRTRLRQLAAYRLGLLASCVCIVLAFWAVSTYGNTLSTGAIEGLLALVAGSFMVLGFTFVLGIPRFSEDQGFASPVRVGFSDEAIHVEYTPSSERARRKVEWAGSEIPWVEVSRVEVPMATFGPARGMVYFYRDGPRPAWKIVRVTNEIVQRALDEAKVRAIPIGSDADALSKPLPS
jgi:hypothetical protein